MARTVTRLSRWLRLDEPTWDHWTRFTTVGSAAILAVAAYAVLAFDRFGTQGLFEPRGAVRFVLVGFYGWVGLSGATWTIGRVRLRTQAPFSDVLRLFGHVHFPLLLLAIIIQGLSVAFRLLGPAMWGAAFTVVFWMPALLTIATRRALSIDSKTAALIVSGPYVVWLVVVGNYLQTQLGHLL